MAALRRLPRGARLLEVGAGAGAMAARLADRFDYVGVEPDPLSYRTAAARLRESGTILHGDIAQVSEQETFTALCAFEVLEHVEDHEEAFAAWLRHLSPGGWVVVSVPAFQDRFGPSDVHVGHYRRYERAQLEDLLAKAGLVDIDIATYGFPLGWLLDRIRGWLARPKQGRTVQQRSAASGRWLQPAEHWGWLTAAIAAPFRLLQRPFRRSDLGIGFVATARRPDHA